MKLRLLPILLACGAPLFGAVETGEINGSQFRIDMPDNYNGSVILYCHGYGGNVKYDQKPLPKQVQVLAEAGYALVQAGYSGVGWAVKEGVEDTEALRRHFARKYGKPKRTYVMGHSMGGIVTLAIMEKFPESYDGALPLCGPLGASLEVLQRRVFDLLVVFDYYYPGVIGSPVKLADNVKMSPEYATQLKKEMDADPQKRAAIQKYAGFASEMELGVGIGFFANIMKELIERAGGNPFDNRDTVYFGGEDDTAINRGVKRYTADPRATEYLRIYYTPKGRPARPILAVHTVYDPIVPTWASNPYADLVRKEGTGERFVQRFVTRPGHCSINPDETLHAFQDLVKWVETGQRPASGEQK
ncbi:MAG: alpha/beta hydrolase [Acidobacteria bacterium]|nr:alpha/beta hydrolase [Acidobacteriota bacterium]